MNWMLLSCFMGLAVAMVLPGLWRPEYRLQFPCLAGLTVIFQVALPLLGLNLDREALPPTSLSRLSFMAILCLGASWAGYSSLGKPRGRPSQFDPKRLTFAAFILVAVGFAFILKARHTMPDFDPEKGGMTGIGTVYQFFAAIMRYGFVLGALLVLSKRNWKVLPLVLPQVWYYINLFLVGRRGPTGEFVLIVLLVLFFCIRWSPPFWLLIAGTVLLAIFCFEIDHVRGTVGLPLRERLSVFRAARPIAALSPARVIDNFSYVEMFNAANYMEAKARGGHYTWGTHFWNQIVFGYVPAQFVGREFKEAIQFQLEDDTLLTGFEKSTGSCESGIAEAFMAFGYFGCALFFLLGALMRWLWERALLGGVFEQCVLSVTLLGAVLSFSSQLWPILNALLHVLIFAGPLFWWSKSRQVRFQRERVLIQSGRSEGQECAG